MGHYCTSRFVTIRRKTREVFVGNVGVGADNPIRVQSMTTTPTLDIEATVSQARALIEAGCEIVRITAPNRQSAQALGEIRKRLDEDKLHVPLVADIHFLPSAAMEAVEHVEKVRVNPGNYADKKKFLIREYSDAQYEEELDRLYEAFSPLVLRCRELGKSMRIGTNHGSLSDRIMNRFGDTPLGMAESALEFIRIAESHGYKDIILSMKASNPKVMIQAYRLTVKLMDAENMHYPLHLGVTEAGDGEDGRIKSAIGIGSLLMDGLGDTIRVSLTEDPIYEIPVAQALAEKVSSQWGSDGKSPSEVEGENLDPFQFSRREIEPINLPGCWTMDSQTPPRVFAINPEADFSPPPDGLPGSMKAENAVEGWIVKLDDYSELEPFFRRIMGRSFGSVPLLVEVGPGLASGQWLSEVDHPSSPVVFALRLEDLSPGALRFWFAWSEAQGLPLALGTHPKELRELGSSFSKLNWGNKIFYLHGRSWPGHILGQYRALAATLESLGIKAPIWIRNKETFYLEESPGFLNDLLEASLLSGSLLCDGIGDFISVESVTHTAKAVGLAYNVLQGAGSRISKTEYVACPSCGRTLFDLQTTTQKIREHTGHLKGLKIAVMGCIVNGPGEMADADFGYVGGARGKVNLYVGKDCVEYQVPEDQAVERLIDLITREGKWTEAPAKTAG